MEQHNILRHQERLGAVRKPYRFVLKCEPSLEKLRRMRTQSKREERDVQY